MKTFYIYILASRKNGTLYIGMTSDIARRLTEHKTKILEGFSLKYHVDKLVYIESTNDVRVAIQRETRLKRWNRAWKIALIETENPSWNDLSYLVFGR